MYLNEVKNVVSVCVAADVVPSIAGHRGIGKTQAVDQIGANWSDPWMNEGEKGIPVWALYCATQDVADLVGFPIQTWESDDTPVVRGIPSKKDNDTVVTSWAKPEWVSLIEKHCAKYDKSDAIIREEMIKSGASKEEINLFWNRPKYIVFLDEVKRAPREVIMAMYPFILDKTLHMHRMPRGTRIVTADNFAGAYDLREPDEAFMSRFCHIEAESDIKTWSDWATESGVSPKVRGFLAAHREMLMSVPKDQEEASVKYVPNPDPRSWSMVDRIEKYGRTGLSHLPIEVQDVALKTAIRGIVGLPCAEAYWKFSAATISIEDILKGKKSLKGELAKYKSAIDQNKVKEKLQIETAGAMKNRKFDKKEAERFAKYLVELNAKDKAVSILQAIFLMKNSNELDERWVKELMDGKDIMDLIAHLVKKKNV